MRDIIIFENVSLRIAQSSILDNISLKIHEYERIAIFGKSGSGKSTLLKMIVGAHIPTAGRILFKNQELTRQNISKVRQSIAYIGQEPILGAELVEEALLLPFSYRANRHQRPPEEVIQQTLDLVELDSSILTQKSIDISGGEKQRIAIARSLLLKKSIFLLDEVTSALDIESKQAVLSLFCNHRDVTILSVTHDFEWLKQCSRFIEIDNGRLKSIHKDFSKIQIE